MTCCLNPYCSQPKNSDSNNFCESCGQPLFILRNRYQPTKLLSDEGGFGRTYLALDLDKLKTECVIKQLAPQVQGTAALKKAQELFEQEAQQLQELGEHSQIPELLAFFEEKGFLYLIQQYIKGNTLDKLVKQKPWNETQVKEFLTNILPVLSFIHKKGIIHRDIKPNNIIKRTSDNQYVLIDFGASKELTETIATKATKIGTFGYAAREQLIEGKVYASSDLYSLGVTCFYLLTKVDPTILYTDQGYEWLKNWQTHLKQPLTPQFQEFLGKLLQKEAQNRYPTAAAALNVLNAPLPQPKTPPKPTIVQIPTPVPPRTRTSTITRANFLSYLAMAGTGVIGTIIVNSLLNQQKIIPTPEPTPKPTLELQTFSFETVQVDSYGNITTRETKTAEYITLDLGNGVTMDLVKIPGGTFTMGSPESEQDRSAHEGPQHEVTIKPFFMGKYQVTQAQWQAVMGNKPSFFKDPPKPPLKGGQGDRPVDSVSWEDCIEFCKKLNEMLQKQPKNVIIERGQGITLPSEAQWEYACRAGTSPPFYFGETITPDLVNYNGNYPYGSAPKGIYRQETTPVGTFPPNAFGLYDMHGNVWEWCLDNWHDNYEGSPTDGSAWLDEQKDSNIKVMRGGSWGSISILCRCANRYRYSRDHSNAFRGLRVAVGFDSIT